MGRKSTKPERALIADRTGKQRKGRSQIFAPGEGSRLALRVSDLCQTELIMTNTHMNKQMHEFQEVQEKLAIITMTTHHDIRKRILV